MRLTVLCDNNTYIDRYFLAEPAVSYLIEDGAHTILFDAGYSDVFIENADRMELDLARVTDIVLSHGHNDHTGGLCAFFDRFHQPISLFAHPDTFLPKREGGLMIGAPMRENELPDRVSRHIARTPQQVSPHVRCLGEIPRVHPEELDRAVGEIYRAGAWHEDRVMDDTALLLNTAEGAFVVTGCTHAGAMNLIDRAAAENGGRAITGLLGGLHLFECGGYASECIDYLREKGLSVIYPAHCIALPVKAALCRSFAVAEVGVSLEIAWDTPADGCKQG